MELRKVINANRKVILCIGCIFLISNFTLKAQIVSVQTINNISFGAFILGNTGGEIKITHDGIRSATGDLTLANLNTLSFPAMFEIDAIQGTQINILNTPDIQLSGSNGGSVTLKLGTPDTGYNFTTTAVSPQRTAVNIGGTLTIGSSQGNPGGNYSGIFSVTFIVIEE
jgi:hypothetical protein